uniref:Putative WD repeat-containing protein C17D11.16 n=1 Tax=Anthurium amnicola TaxID=1678845 RepID=A0A1D1ZFD5_9ARAE
MISAVCWVPKGAPKVTPVAAEPPSKEEIEEMWKKGALDGSGGSEGEEDEGMDVDAAKEGEEVAHALAAAEALGQTKGNASFGQMVDLSDGLRELNMDHYDDEDDGFELFGSGLGDAYYPSNEMDPHLKNNDDDDDDDDEEVEDNTIKPTDAVIICARTEDEVGHLEVWVYEELEGESNLYVHHDIMLPAFPLCTAWLDCNTKSGDKGNFIAVGSMETAIEIWDLDLLDEVQPSVILGGVVEKRKGKKSSAKYKKGSHRESVLGLAWNKEVRNVLASASADKSVKVWDVVTQKCALTLAHHTDKVQAVEWNQHSPEILLSGSFDQSVVMIDMKSNGRPANRWSVTDQVESIRFDPHNEHFFVVSLNDGKVQAFDIRAASTALDSGSKPCFTLHAHDDAVCAVSYNPSAPNLLATGSTDKMVKLWDLSNNQPSCVTSRNPKAGAVFSLSFSEDSPFSLAIGGSKGRLKVWDTLSDEPVSQKYGKFSNHN